jgi:hypothetical protein
MQFSYENRNLATLRAMCGLSIVCSVHSTLWTKTVIKADMQVYIPRLLEEEVRLVLERERTTSSTKPTSSTP